MFDSESSGIAQCLAADSSTLYHWNKSKNKEQFKQYIQSDFLNDSQAVLNELPSVIFKLAKWQVLKFKRIYSYHSQPYYGF